MFIAFKYDDAVLNQMSITDNLLNKLQNHLVKPVVAGGAPRDWYFNTTATDVDIFVDPQDISEDLIKTLEELGAQNISLKTSEELPEHYRSDYISSVLTFTKNRVTFQIIVKTSTENVLIHFPCSLSLITYEGLSIKPTHLFIKSVKKATIYFKLSCNQKYERKIIQKFSGYKVSYRNTLDSDVRVARPRLEFDAIF